MRSRSPDFLTLPSSTVLTLSFLAMSVMFVFLPLKENAEVRAATFMPSIFANALSSSSAKPSQKYSFSTSTLMLAKGKTAIDVMGGGSVDFEAEPEVVGSNSAANSICLFAFRKSPSKSLAVW